MCLQFEIFIRDAKIQKLEQDLADAKESYDRHLRTMDTNMAELKREIVEVDAKRMKLKDTLEKAWIFTAGLEAKLLECEAQVRV